MVQLLLLRLVLWVLVLYIPLRLTYIYQGRLLDSMVVPFTGHGLTLVMFTEIFVPMTILSGYYGWGYRLQGELGPVIAFLTLYTALGAGLRYQIYFRPGMGAPGASSLAPLVRTLAAFPLYYAFYLTVILAFLMVLDFPRSINSYRRLAELWEVYPRLFNELLSIR